jgi:hypothetical protein
VAIVDSIGDVVGMLENETNIYYSETTNVASAKTKTELCAMDGNHGYTDITDKTHTTPSCDKCGLAGGVTEAHSYKCDTAAGNYKCICGKVVQRKTVTEGVTCIVLPEALKIRSNEANNGQTAVGIFADGDAYIRYSGTNQTTGAAFSAVISNNGSLTTNGAQYLVVKMRTNMPKISSAWRLWLNGGANGAVTLDYTAVCTGEWVTYIADIKTINNYYGNGGTINELLLTVNYDNNIMTTLPVGASQNFKDYTVDIAYVAFVNDLATVLELSDAERVSYSKKSGVATTMTKAELEALDN